MALFQTDSLVLCYSDVEAAKQWWIRSFDCKPTTVRSEWDYPLPSDVALKLPGDSEPTILLCNKAEVMRAGFDRQNDHPILFSSKLNKAHEHVTGRGAVPGPIREGGGTQFFEISDPEGNVIEICKEP